MRGIIKVYSGTSLENFYRCTEVNGKEIWFVKNLEPKYRADEVYCTSSLGKGAFYAIFKSQGLDHIPLILGGEIDGSLIKSVICSNIFTCNEFILDGPFPVNEIWLPREDARIPDLLRGGGPIFAMRWASRLFERLPPLDTLLSLGVI